MCLQVLETVEARLPPEARRELYLLLRLLGSRLGCLLLLGRQSFGCACCGRGWAARLHIQHSPAALSTAPHVTFAHLSAPHLAPTSSSPLPHLPLCTQRRLAPLVLRRPAPAAARGSAAVLEQQPRCTHAQGERVGLHARLCAGPLIADVAAALVQPAATVPPRLPCPPFLSPTHPFLGTSFPFSLPKQAFKALKSLVMSVQFTHLTPGGNSELLAAMG